jgi:hypothetical protein
MSTAAAAMRISKSRPFWLIGVIVAVFAGLFLSICIGIVHDASLQELHPADAIVVFGAAEYAGRPSPVYRARLDHAYELLSLPQEVPERILNSAKAELATIT